MTPKHETEDYLLNKAFCALCDCITRLSRRPSLELPEKMETARRNTIQSAVSMAPDLKPDKEPLYAAMKTPSLEVARALFEGEHKKQWLELLDQLMQSWLRGEEGGIRYTLPIEYISIDHLLYLEDLGLPLEDTLLTLGQRMISDPDPRIDPILARITSAKYNEPDPILHAHSWSTTALQQMHPRHLRRLEQLLTSDRSDFARACLEALSERLIMPRNWREAALLIRIGFYPGDCLDRAPETVIALAEKTRSAHGRLALIEQEPDLEAMTERGPQELFFGIRIQDVQKK